MNSKSSLILILISTIITLEWVRADKDSKCPNTNCTPAPDGTTCEAKYDRDDGCCPVWHCSNGQTVYGKSSSSSGFSGSSSSFSFGTPGANPFQGGLPGGGLPGFPKIGGGNGGIFGGGFPFFGRR